MNDIKLILEVEKHSELYEPQHQFYKDNVKKDHLLGCCSGGCWNKHVS